ncbi:hypothetical protein PsorP6_017615 [Peronosclerospora sorghi]|uniref:Uncharacterized protein n=1 Tax=Peronosclerospora sorghi TaxID=230839 RepID=A0ACC0WLM1_9STRA|nr:hypothetical protein PsorP6_017615 [Peronosclerospora sorghi]
MSEPGNETTGRVDAILTGYFRGARGRGKRRRARRPSAPTAPTASDTCAAMYLTQLKRLLRDASSSMQSQYIHQIYTVILDQLKHAPKSSSSPVVLSRTLTLCAELFARSKVFRAVITSQTASFFDHLLRAAGGPPQVQKTVLKRLQRPCANELVQVLALIETWTQTFGEQYPALVAGYTILRERGYNFPKHHETHRAQQEHDRACAAFRDRLIQAKRRQREREMHEYVPEMEQVLVELHRVFEMLIPTLEAFQVVGQNDADKARDKARGTNGEGRDQQEEGTRNWDEGHDDVVHFVDEEEEEDDDVEWENVTTAETDTMLDGKVYDPSLDAMKDIVQAYGLGSSSYHLTIELSTPHLCPETSDNDALLRSVADGALRIQKRFLPLLDDWEATTHSVRPDNVRPDRVVVHEIHDLRDRLTRTLSQCHELVRSSPGRKRPRRETRPSPRS